MNKAKLAQAATEGMFTNTPTKSTKAGKTHKAAVKEGSGQQAKRDLVTYSVISRVSYLTAQCENCSPVPKILRKSATMRCRV